jgi:Mrp family chromosome partitioning ATPase
LQYSFEDGGVEEVLDGKQPLHQLLRQIGDHPLFVLGIKNRLISPGSLLSSQALADLIAKLRAKFKWVVLDFAPVIPMADVTEVIPHVDGVIMVVRARRTEKSMILPAIEMLESKLWGVVANDCPIDGSSYYGYYGVRKD